MATGPFQSYMQGLVCLLPAVLASPPTAVVLADSQATALLASASLGVVLAEARHTAFLAHVSS